MRMRHPIHGFTNAVGPEIEWNKANGWIEEVAAAPVVVDKAPAEVVNSPGTLAERYEAKFGKPPDRRWSDKTIQAALDEE